MNYLLNTSPITTHNEQFGGTNPDIKFDKPTSNTKDELIERIDNKTQSKSKTFGFDIKNKIDFYKYIAVDIVSESVFKYPYNYITEKTLKPLAHGRPFIIVGPVDSLKALNNYGFRTFSSIIDETYDSINDDEQRFFAVCNTIKKFVERPLVQVVDDVNSVKSTILHNQNIMRNLIQVETTSILKQINSYIGE